MNNYVYWKNLLEKNNCAKCQQKFTFPTKEFEEDLEHHPDVYVRKEGIFHDNCLSWKDSSWEKAIQDTETKEFKNWEGIVKSYPCFSCDYNFTEKDIQEKNWQIKYANAWEEKEIYQINHLDCFGCCACQMCQKAHENLKKSRAGCFVKGCKKKFGNLMIYDSSDTPKHPECVAKEKGFWKFHTHPKILGIEIENQRIIGIFEHDRRISIPISWLIEKWRWPKNIKPEQLKKYEIDLTGFRVNFEIDEEHDTDLTAFMFTEGACLGKCGCCS